MGKVQDVVKEGTNDVYNMRPVAGQRRNGIECCNEEVDVAVAEKEPAFEEWLRRRDMDFATE